MDISFEALVKRIGQGVRLRSTKIDGSPHWEWTCRLIAASPDAIALQQAAGTPIRTWAGAWTPDFGARVYFWRGAWFNVIHTLNADGGLRDYYCNIITPARVEDGELQWTDLILDVRVQADGMYWILDEEEWSHAIERGSLAPEAVLGARRALAELTGLIARRVAPFDALTPLPHASGA